MAVGVGLGKVMNNSRRSSCCSQKEEEKKGDRKTKNEEKKVKVSLSCHNVPAYQNSKVKVV